MNDILARILDTKRTEVATARQMRSESSRASASFEALSFFSFRSMSWR